MKYFTQCVIIVFNKGALSMESPRKQVIQVIKKLLTAKPDDLCWDAKFSEAVKILKMLQREKALKKPLP